MNFHNLWALPLLLLPILAFLNLRKQKTEQIVPSLLYFRDLSGRQWLPSLVFVHRWERWIYALILFLGALIALNLYFKLPSQRTLLILDDSASMQVIPTHEKSRFELAKQKLQAEGEKIQRLSGQVRMVPLWGSADHFEFTNNPTELNQQIDNMKVLSTGGLLENRLPNLLAEARHQSVGQVVIATDRPLGTIPHVEGIKWIDVTETEEPLTNLAITSIKQPQKLYDIPAQTQLTLANFSASPTQDIQLLIKTSDDKLKIPFGPAFTMGANTVKIIDLEPLPEALQAMRNQPLKISVTHQEDVLALDNSVWLLPRNTSPLQVLLIPCQSSDMLWRWLFPHPEIRLTKTQDKEEEKKLISQGNWDIIIYDGCPNPPRITEIIGHTIIIAPANSPDEAPVIVQWQSAWYDNPLLQDIKPLDRVRLHRPQRRRIPEAEWVMPLFSQHQYIYRQGSPSQQSGLSELTYAVENEKGQRLLYLGFDAHFHCDSEIHGGGTFRQDDCLSMIFLLMNTLQWMAPKPSDIHLYLPTGRIYQAKGLGEHQIFLWPNNKPLSTLSPTSQQWLLSDSGRYHYQSDTHTQWLSVGLFDSVESSLSRPPVNPHPAWRISGSSNQSQPIWRWLLWALWFTFWLEALQTFVRLMGIPKSNRALSN